MSDNPAGLLPLFAALAVAVASPLLTALAWILVRTGRRERFAGALGTVAAVAVGATLALGTAVAVVAGPVAGAVAVASVAAAGVVLAVFPLAVGRSLLGRWTPLDPDRALGYATLGWPVALAASLVVFLAPGTGRPNVTFLAGPAAAAALALLFLVVTFGPALVGLAVYRLRRRRRSNPDI